MAKKESHHFAKSFRIIDDSYKLFITNVTD